MIILTDWMNFNKYFFQLLLDGSCFVSFEKYQILNKESNVTISLDL